MKRVLIATPTYDGRLYADYVRSIVKLLQSDFALLGDIEFTGPFFIEGTGVTHARNAFASLMLETPSLTHLLFVDADMGFRPEAVHRLLKFDQPFVGCVYPYRRLDTARAHAVARHVKDPGTAAEIGLNYVTGEALIREELAGGGSALRVENGFSETLGVGLGLAAIQRTVFEQMADRLPDLMAEPGPFYSGVGIKDKVFQCFESEKDEDGRFTSEDVAFCRRWRRECGGRIWACVDERITHSGAATFAGTFLERIKYDAWLERQPPGV